MWGDSYDQCGSKNQGFHNGRNFGGHFLIEHPVSWDDDEGEDFDQNFAVNQGKWPILS